MITATRYHDFSAGHRVVGHESKCRWLHGHNYRVTFHVQADLARALEETRTELDDLGRVLDFSVLKSLLCEWVERRWDHRMLLWNEDPMLGEDRVLPIELADSIVRVPFNPTAENMAAYLLRVVGPERLANTGVQLVQVTVEETRKCSATARL
jgi:6-pyruvoyltetrahydropterin/6-carboxytetrahydropterin synthase